MATQEYISSTEIDNIAKFYNSNGTNVPSHVTGASVNLPSASGITPGAGIGVAVPVTLNTIFSQLIGYPSNSSATETIVLNGTSNFINLNDIVTPTLSAWSPYEKGNISFGNIVGNVNDGTKRLEFLTPVGFYISTNPVTNVAIPIGMTISGYDEYGNKMTLREFSLSTANPQKFYKAPRCFKSITSIRFSNFSGANITLYIAIGARYELPYYNLGASANLMGYSFTYPAGINNNNFSFNFSGGRNVAISAVEPYIRVGNAFEIINPPSVLNQTDPLETPDITYNSGTVRPIIDIYNFGNTIFDLNSGTFSGLADGCILTIIQNVYGLGDNLPNYFLAANGNINLQATPLNDQNNSLLVIGPPQYSGNWEPWQEDI